MNIDNDIRKEKIMRILSSENKVFVKELSQKFNVTTETIRRDLQQMEKEGRLKRVHGGAVKISYFKQEPPHEARYDISKIEKERIGIKAATLIKEGDYIFIDVGTTCACVARYLGSFKELIVVTNNIDALNILVERRRRGDNGIKVIFIGGQVNSTQLSTYGSMAERNLDDFRFDISFLAVGGMSLGFGISGYELNECRFTSKVIEKSQENVVLCDSRKVGVSNYIKICDLSLVSHIVAGVPCPIEWENKIKKDDIKWHLA